MTTHEQDPSVCPQCGAKVASDRRYCVHCYSPVGATAFRAHVELARETASTHRPDPTLVFSPERHEAMVRRALVDIQRRRWPLRTGGTADAFYPEARLWLSVGDTAAAREHLDSAFAFLRRGSPVSFAGVGVTLARVGSLLRAAELRAAIASPAEPGGPARWRMAMSSLTSKRSAQ